MQQSRGRSTSTSPRRYTQIDDLAQPDISFPISDIVPQCRDDSRDALVFRFRDEGTRISAEPKKPTCASPGAALTIAILTALLASLYPAWRVMRWAPAATLREE